MIWNLWMLSEVPVWWFQPRKFDCSLCRWVHFLTTIVKHLNGASGSVCLCLWLSLVGNVKWSCSTIFEWFFVNFIQVPNLNLFGRQWHLWNLSLDFHASQLWLNDGEWTFWVSKGVLYEIVPSAHKHWVPLVEVFAIFEPRIFLWLWQLSWNPVYL